jgi:hypothetical protein
MRLAYFRQTTIITSLVFCAWLANVARAEEKGETAKPAEKAKAAGDETAETTPEQLAERLEFEWTQISAQASRPIKQQGINRSINVSGQVKIVKELDILALGQQTELTEAIDETGKDWAPPPLAKEPQGLLQRVAQANPFARRAAAVPQQRYYQFPHRMPAQAPWFGALNPTGINVNINLDQGEVPNRLAKVKGTLTVLVGKSMPPVDIAAAASDEWTELSPDLSIRLTKAEMQNGSIQYQLESRGDEAVKNFHGWVGPNQALPKTLITKVAFVDEFNQEHEISSGMAFNPNTSGSAGFGNTGRLVTMRFIVATDVHEVAVPFEIKDLEVPTFGERVKDK